MELNFNRKGELLNEYLNISKKRVDQLNLIIETHRNLTAGQSIELVLKNSSLSTSEMVFMIYTLGIRNGFWFGVASETGRLDKPKADNKRRSKNGTHRSLHEMQNSKRDK